jgi:hypothetical protein
MEVYDKYIHIMPPLIFILGDIFPMLEYASIHNTCKLHVVLDSKVIKTQFRLDSVYTCHMMLCPCHISSWPGPGMFDFEINQITSVGIWDNAVCEFMQ